MSLRPHLDRLAQDNGGKITVEAVLKLIWTEEVFAIWQQPRQKQGWGDPVDSLFGHRHLTSCTVVELQRLHSIVDSWTSTLQHRAEERARGCPFEGAEWIPENTIESALEYAELQKASVDTL